MMECMAPIHHFTVPIYYLRRYLPARLTDGHQSGLLPVGNKPHIGQACCCCCAPLCDVVYGQKAVLRCAVLRFRLIELNCRKTHDQQICISFADPPGRTEQTHNNSSAENDCQPRERERQIVDPIDYGNLRAGN